MSTLLLAILLYPGGLVRAQAQRASTQPPNMLVFVADDLGWRDLGVYGNRSVRTPNLNQLARSGLRVMQAFGTSPQCSPSRISTLSGRYSHATRTEDLHTPVPEGVRLLPSYLQARGYFTGMMAKTHIGPAGDRQFQWYSPKLAQAFPEFLDSAGTRRPFLLWVGFHDPHRPYQPQSVPRPHDPARVSVPPHLVNDSQTRRDLALYYDEISQMDGEIGRMLAELNRRQLGNTLVVFFSDNGAPFPREKGTLYDAGTRTPLILSWPSVIQPGAVYRRGLVSLIDLTPTLLELAGASLPEGMQGRSFRPLFTSPDSYPGRAHVFSERNWHDCDEHQRAVRTVRFKLIRTDAYLGLPLCTAADIGASPSFLALRTRARAGRLTPVQQRLFQTPRARLELYDLQRDPWELTNVADDPTYAEDVRQLAGVLQEWMEQSDDFPAAYRTRADNTDRLTGVQLHSRIPPLGNENVPAPPERWGRQGPT